jgi:hypothetical protein
MTWRSSCGVAALLDQSAEARSSVASPIHRLADLVREVWGQAARIREARACRSGHMARRQSSVAADAPVTWIGSWDDLLAGRAQERRRRVVPEAARAALHIANCGSWSPDVPSRAWPQENWLMHEPTTSRCHAAPITTHHQSGGFSTKGVWPPPEPVVPSPHASEKDDDVVEGGGVRASAGCSDRHTSGSHSSGIQTYDIALERRPPRLRARQRVASMCAIASPPHSSWNVLVCVSASPGCPAVACRPPVQEYPQAPPGRLRSAPPCRGPSDSSELLHDCWRRRQHRCASRSQRCRTGQRGHGAGVRRCHRARSRG